MSEIELGPFILHEPIGRGGMGEVWRGVHRHQQLPVAIKMLTVSASRETATCTRSAPDSGSTSGAVSTNPVTRATPSTARTSAARTSSAIAAAGTTARPTTR